MEGDQHKMREALITCRNIAEWIRSGNASVEAGVERMKTEIDKSLSAPARNCDRFNSGDPDKDADDALHAYLDEGVAGFRAVARYLLSPIKEKPCIHATDATI